MRSNPDYELTDPEQIEQLVDAHPWAIMVTATSRGVVASHLPILVDERAPLSVVGHLGRPDDVAHELGSHEVMIIVSGPNGYVSPGWYGLSDAVPTWNYVAAHLYGVPEVLDAAETVEVLAATVERFERVRSKPMLLDLSSAYVQQISGGTAGFRMRPTRVHGKSKLSQDKPQAVVSRILAALDSDATYSNSALANEMRRVHQR
jgi:transcriptional regulator